MVLFKVRINFRLDRFVCIMADALHYSFVEKTTTLQEQVDPELLRSMREGVPQDLTGVPKREKQENDAIPKVAPKWLKHDR